MNNFFYDTCIIVSDEFLKNVMALINTADSSTWKSILDMKLLPVPVSILETEPKLLKIAQYYEATARISVYDTAPNTAFHWHTDRTRFASLNLLIDGWDSKCFFADNKQNGMMNNLTELIYKKNQIHLLNVTKQHCVLNFNNPRYMFSIGIPMPATFDEVKEFIRQL